MDLVFKSGLIMLSMRVNGAKIKPMAEENSGTPMAISMRVNGKTTRLMALVFIFTLMVLNMKATGKMISKTDKAWRAGKTVADMRVDTKKA